MAETHQVLVASNRGPLSHRLVDGTLVSSRGGGGLVTALSSLTGDPTALWVCAAMSSADRAAVAAATPTGRLDADGLGVLMLDIDEGTFADAYDGIANSTLWFLHHQLFNLAVEPVFDAAFSSRWEGYRRFNGAFADALAGTAAPGATVLIQDYHLCLAPALLRKARPDLAIGHFSHTPWAPVETFAILPAEVRRDLLLGILAADRVGFLSPRWATAFAACCVEFLGAEYDGTTVSHDGHTTVLSVHALGVDPDTLRAMSDSDDVAESLRLLEFPGLQVIARVDRAELSKNIVRGLLAYAELLRTYPVWRGRVVHALMAYPSRGGLPAYQAYMEEVLRVAAAVNEEFSTPDWEAVHLLHEDNYPLSLALLRRSDVLLINPVRDGMNLVAKEGPLLSEHAAALVLSTGAGAADELGSAALMVDPFDVSATAAALHAGLSMSAPERASRAAALRAAAVALPPQAWFAEQRDALIAGRAALIAGRAAPVNSVELTALLQPTSIDARRGVVRLHAEVLSALGAQVWDVVELTGTRRTGAIVARAPDGSDRRILYADELVLANLGVASGSVVRVSRAVTQPAVSITVNGTPAVVAAVSPETVRLALLGKVVTIGDQVSLLPQDVSPPVGATTSMLDEARHQLLPDVGPAWTGLLLQVEQGPAKPSVVTMSTVLRWADGRQTSGSSAGAGSLAFPGPSFGGPSFGGPSFGGPSFGGTARSASPDLPPQFARTAPPLGAPPLHAPPFAPGTLPAAAGTPASGSRPVIPGLERQAAQLREWWDLGFHQSDLLRRLGASPDMGVLISGPAGSGKVSLIRTVAAELGAQVIHLWGPAVAALEPTGAAQRIRTAIAQANDAAPAVLLIEDVEAIAPREEGGPLTSLVREEVMGLVRAGIVAIACTTSRPEIVSAELRHPGALDHQLVVPLPDRAQRRALLTVLCQPLPLGADVALDDVAARTPGFVAADISALAREAATRAANRLSREPAGSATTVLRSDFDSALEVVRPTSMGASTLEVGRVTLDEVGDMIEVKKALTEAVLWPLSYPETFARMGISPPRGVLLYGPPGCGKTYLVKAVAAAGEANVLSVKGAELLSKYVGDSEAGVRELFRRAREAAPSLVFLDEVDALAPVRGQSTDSGVTDRVVAALLTELDGVEDMRDVVVIGATNRPELVDPALLRPGRLERLVYVPPPDAEARALILKAAAAKVPLDPEVDLTALAGSLELWSSADLSALIRESAMTAMRRSLDSLTVTAADVATARTVVKPSLRADQVAALAAYAEARAAS